MKQRILFIVALTLSVYVHAQTPDIPLNDGIPDTLENRQDADPVAPFPVDTEVDEAISSANVIDFSHKNSDELNLSYQRTIANSNKWLAILGGLSLLVSSLVAYYIRRTLKVNEDLIDATTRSVEAAEESTQSAIEMLRKDRAWICLVDRVEGTTKREAETGNLIGAEVLFRHTNLGASPGLSVKTHCEICNDLESFSRDSAIAEMGTHPPSNIGQKQSTMTGLVFNTEKGFLYALEQSPIVYLCCEFTTIYGEQFLIEDTVKLDVFEPVKAHPRKFTFHVVPANGFNTIRKTGEIDPI